MLHRALATVAGNCDQALETALHKLDCQKSRVQTAL